MLVSHELIQGIPIQGPFNLDDFPLECFHSKEDVIDTILSFEVVESR